VISEVPKNVSNRALDAPQLVLTSNELATQNALKFQAVAGQQKYLCDPNKPRAYYPNKYHGTNRPSASK
jgi:hypothetical protein